MPSNSQRTAERYQLVRETRKVPTAPGASLVWWQPQKGNPTVMVGNLESIEADQPLGNVRRGHQIVQVPLTMIKPLRTRRNSRRLV